MSRVVITAEFNGKRLNICQTSTPEQDAQSNLDMPTTLLDEAYKTLRAELVAQIKEGGE